MIIKICTMNLKCQNMKSKKKKKIKNEFFREA